MVLIIRTSQLSFKWWSCVLKCYKYRGLQHYWHPDDELKRGKLRKLRLFHLVHLWLLGKCILMYYCFAQREHLLFWKCVNYCFCVQVASPGRLCHAITAGLFNHFGGLSGIWRSAVNVPIAAEYTAEYIMSSCHDTEREEETGTTLLWPVRKYRWFVSSDCFSIDYNEKHLKWDLQLKLFNSKVNNVANVYHIISIFVNENEI